MNSGNARLWIWSDIHAEFPENAWDPAAHAPADGFDVAVVAGDVHTPLTRALDWLGERMRGTTVAYVPGNHDYYFNGGEDRYTIYDQMERGRDRAAALGIHLLLDETVTLAGVRLVGATLWSDYYLSPYGVTQAMRIAQGRFGMNDYRRIRTGPRSRNRIEPPEILAMHRASRGFIEAELARPHDGPTVVVTHHAPHPASLPDPHDDLAWCYASDLTGLIIDRGPDVWIHGHVHRASDYRVGRTRVLSNPRGHLGERSGFQPSLVIAPCAPDARHIG